MYVPVEVPLGTVTVTVDVPDVVIEVGLKAVVNPPVVVDESATVPVYPFRGDTVIVEVPWDPALMLRDVGEAEMV